MQMGMKQQVLPPGVKDSQEADLGSQMFGISADGAQGFSRRAEKNAVQHLFVLVGDGGDLFRHGEDNVEVFDGQQFGLAVFEPLGAGERLALGTVPVSAGVVGGALVAAGVTLLQVAAQSGGTAEFDGAHHAPLPA
jgi:hypothetical protein